MISIVDQISDIYDVAEIKRFIIHVRKSCICIYSTSGGLVSKNLTLQVTCQSLMESTRKVLPSLLFLTLSSWFA